jgi:hypothetical protein
LSDDGDVAFDLEQRGESAQDHALVFGENHANLFAAVFICWS